MGAPGGPSPCGAPSIVTPNRWRIGSIGLPIVSPSPPANSNATGWFPPCVTISEPESPGALKAPGLTETWPTNRASWRQNSKITR